MTAPGFRSVCALTGEKSGVPAVLAAADVITAEHDELIRLRAEVKQLKAEVARLTAILATTDRMTSAIVDQLNVARKYGA